MQLILSLLEVVTDVERHLTESNDLFVESVETDSKKETWKKVLKKRKAQAALARIPNKFQLKYTPDTLNVWEL